jgi:peptidyl-prolyl cis-trans isomerase C
VNSRIGTVAASLARGAVTALRKTSGGMPSGGFRVQGVAAVLLVLVAGGSGAKLVTHQMDELPADAALRVSGQTISKDQLNRRVNMMEALYGLQQPKDAKGKSAFNRSVAKALAVSEIVDGAAKQRGIVIADKAASDQLNKLITDNGGQDRQSFLRGLGTRGISEQQVLEEVKRQQENARLFSQITGSTKPSTDQQARGYYTANKPKMVSPEQRDLANIVVSSQQQAKQVAQQASSGSDFAALAKQYSIDGSTKTKGGSLGTVTADQLESGYSNAAFRTKSGSVFGPVQTKQGWNVGKVGAIHKATPLSFDQVKSAIKSKLDNDAKLKTWDAFLATQIKSADVTYAPDYQPANPDGPPDNAAGS